MGVTAPRPPHGFSLLESLVALAFLALAALAVVATFLFSTRLDTSREARHEAALLALDSMEEARRILALDLEADVTLPPAPHPENDRFAISRTQNWLGEELELQPFSLKEVTVEVTWGSANGLRSYILKERFRKE